jgi:hypothetical protein
MHFRVSARALPMKKPRLTDQQIPLLCNSGDDHTIEEGRWKFGVSQGRSFDVSVYGV